MLWQCTTCGACENQCPVGIEHLPILIGARRGLVSNGDAPDYLGADVQQPRAPRQHLGPRLRPAAEVRRLGAARDLRSGAGTTCLVWLGCAGAFEADFQKSLRSLFEILRAQGVKFGVLSKERCTGDPAKRTGNEYMFQELATANIEDLKAAGAEEDPDVVPALREDDRRRLPQFGYEVEDRPLVGARRGADCGTSSRRPSSTESGHLSRSRATSGATPATVDEPRALLERFGADIKEPERNRDNPYCCGAGGGLLFADKEEEPGSRISDVRFKQLQATGATPSSPPVRSARSC